MCLQWWKQPPDGWKHIPCPMPPPNTWAKEHGIEWVYHILYHAPASGKIEQYSGMLKTTLRAMGAGTFKYWDIHLAKATWSDLDRISSHERGIWNAGFTQLLNFMDLKGEERNPTREEGFSSWLDTESSLVDRESLSPGLCMAPAKV
ncbi:hypothetical protein QYF61_000320 [Mycteria americana]|uniref:Uncharacterized protein n=1 Tax=Mycteria americana TaxID=33587 RepID=A0AAN7N965_MYCAM|nr:hypothetical protein QYF61_000320 [Mycteria americana]